MSSWKLVEAIPEVVPEVKPASRNSSNNHSFRGGGGFSRSNGSGGRNNRSSGNGRGRNRGGRGNSGVSQQDFQLSQTDRNYLAYLAVQQIELLFNPDNLCMDTYIRSFMDVAGFIPVALTLNYPNVAAINAFYDDILNRLQEVNGVSRLEFDAANETVRLKEGWEMWLMPNAFGGRGQPRYIKQVHDVFQQGSVGFDGQPLEQLNNDYSNTADGGDENGFNLGSND